LQPDLVQQLANLRRGFLNHASVPKRGDLAKNLQGFRPADSDTGYGSLGSVRLAKPTFKRSLSYKHGVVACFRWLGLPIIFRSFPLS
jgi:hypothetical protein